MNSPLITEKNFNNLLSKHTNSSMISDILFEYGIEQTISGYTTNLQNTRIFGKASTMKIRKLETGENSKGIYDALKTYSHIPDGNIIVVETEVPNRAYFGELNANISIRTGVIGTIVGGKTRDIECVTELGYPVFSKGYSSSDVKGYGTLDSFDKPIKLENIVINPGDYIFADVNGIVIIPLKLIDTVKESIISCINKEMNVKINVISGIDADDIPKITGFF